MNPTTKAKIFIMHSIMLLKNIVPNNTEQLVSITKMISEAEKMHDTLIRMEG